MTAQEPMREAFNGALTRPDAGWRFLPWISNWTNSLKPQGSHRESRGSDEMSFQTKVKFVWKENTMKQLLEQTRGQMSSLQFLISFSNVRLRHILDRVFTAQSQYVRTTAFRIIKVPSMLHISLLLTDLSRRTRRNYLSLWRINGHERPQQKNCWLERLSWWMKNMRLGRNSRARL